MKNVNLRRRRKMKKIWDVELKQFYSLETSSRKYCVTADNAKEAIKKAVNAHKRQAKKNFDDMNFICAVSVELVAIAN
jgi:hypothetical protein